MKSVTVKTLQESRIRGFCGREVWTECGGSHLGESIYLDLAIVPGSTLLCLAPGESLPEAEGWETVDEQTEGASNINVGIQRSHCYGINWTGTVVANKGDCLRLQVRRAPKPKTAVLLRADVVPGKSITQIVRRWLCGACHDFLSEWRDCHGKNEPTECGNCGAHFTETKEL